MPLISEHNKDKEISKRFQKKSYRPWDDDLLTSNHQNSTAEHSLPDNPNITVFNKTKSVHDELYQESSLVDKEEILLPKNHLTELNLKKELRNLFGAQKVIIQYLLTQIEENNNEYVITKAISMDEFTLICKLTPNTIKGMLQKLKIKKLLETYENKPGRGGYARYKFIKEIYTFFSKNLNI